MFSCPECGHDQINGASRCRCGADLRLLHQIDAIANVWFNRALAALDDGSPGRALEWFAAVSAARPNDIEARLALVKLWAHLGRLPEARDALSRAALLEPDSPDIAKLCDALNDSQEKPRRHEKSDDGISISQ